MDRKWIVVSGVVVAVLIGIQFIPTLPKDNLPVTASIEIPGAADSIMRRSCFDCHSNETEWPWYSRVAPMSLFVSHHVEEARDHLNFSEWTNLPADERKKLLEEILEEVEEKKMPLRSYTWIHGEAKLTGADVVIILRWLEGLGVEHDHNH